MTTSVRTKDIQVFELADNLIDQYFESGKNGTLSTVGKISSVVSSACTCYSSWYCLPVAFGSCLFSVYKHGQHSKEASEIIDTVRAISELLVKGAEVKPSIQKDFTPQNIDPKFVRKVHDSCFIFCPHRSTLVRAYIGSIVPCSTEGVGFLMPDAAAQPVSSYYLDGRTIIVANYSGNSLNHAYNDLYKEIIREAKNNRVNTLSIALGEWLPIHSTETIFDTLHEEEYKGYFKEVHLIYPTWSSLVAVGELFMKTEAMSDIAAQDGGYDSDDY